MNIEYNMEHLKCTFHFNLGVMLHHICKYKVGTSNIILLSDFQVHPKWSGSDTRYGPCDSAAVRP